MANRRAYDGLTAGRFLGVWLGRGKMLVMLREAVADDVAQHRVHRFRVAFDSGFVSEL